MKSPKQRYKILVEYLEVKVQEKDWHGVCDAAMDIRDLISAHPEVEQFPVFTIGMEVTGVLGDLVITSIVGPHDEVPE